MATATRATERSKWIDLAGILGPEFAQRAGQHDAEGSFVAENYEVMRRHKLFSAAVPAELGGGGATHAEMCDLLRELAHYDGSTALAFSMHSHLLAVLNWRHRHNATPPAEPVLRRIAAEELVLVSTGGSDWLEGSGRAVKVDGGYRVSGRKIFGSGSPAGHLLLTTAVFNDPKDGLTVLHFGVNMRGDGVAVQDDWRAMGMCGTGSNSIDLTDVFVPEGAITARRPKGKWHRFFEVISPPVWSLVYSVYLGVAEAARDIAVRQAARRRDDPVIQELVGEMETELLSGQAALQAMVALASSEYDLDPATSNRVYQYKTIVARAALRTVEKAMEAVGGTSFFRDLGLERCFRDIQAARFHPFQERRQYVFSGRIALGLEPVG
jgi:alkylation response protein AidB-like acyl-CoA dehydrogenase